MMTTSHSSMVLYVHLFIYQSCHITIAFQMLESLEPDELIGYLRGATPEIQQIQYGKYLVAMRLLVFALT